MQPHDYRPEPVYLRDATRAKRYERVAVCPVNRPPPLLSGSGALHAELTRRWDQVDRTGGGRGPEGVSPWIRPAFLQGQTSRMTTRTHPLFHVPVPWVFVLGYLLGALLERIAPIGSGWTRPVRTDVVGAVLFIAGVLVAGWGWFTFHRAGTTRVPGKVSSTMVTWGPYRFSRTQCTWASHSPTSERQACCTSGGRRFCCR